MTSELNKRELFFSPDIVYSVMITALFIILVIQIYTYFSFKYQINKLSLLFGDFTRFYIHTSKPPCRDFTNLDLLNYVNDKDSSKSVASSGSKSSQSENFNKIDIINENDSAKKIFKPKFRKFKNSPNPASTVIHSNGNHPNSFTLDQLPKYKLGNQRRHSTIDLTNRMIDNIPNDKFSQGVKYKFRHSESYSFDLANKILSHISANESKTNTHNIGNKSQMIPQRRPRLYGISDECSNGKKCLHSIASTSTPNK